MVTFDLELARRFDVPLVRGMAVRTARTGASAGHFVGLCDDGRIVLWAEDDQTSETDAELVLDYTDHGTLGHILAAVRVAWGQPGAFACCGEDGDWAVMPKWGMHDSMSAGLTEAHALAAAWEGRPR